MTKKVVHTSILHMQKKQEPYLLTLVALPLFIFVLGLLLYITTNRNLIPKAQTNNFVTIAPTHGVGKMHVASPYTHKK